MVQAATKKKRKSTSASKKSRSADDYAAYRIARHAAGNMVSRAKCAAANDLYDKLSANDDAVTPIVQHAHEQWQRI